MAIRLSTTLDKIYSVPNPDNSRIIRDFYEYMKANGTSENYQNQNLKAMICAHFFLKVESFGIKNNKIFARLYRSNRIKKDRIDVNLLGRMKEVKQHFPNVFMNPSEC